jgi:AraC family transcriptional regulator
VIEEERGVRASIRGRHGWPGVTRAVLDLRWETEPGWLTLSFGSPTLYVVASEIGGRCQTRTDPDLPAQGEYFGSGHLSFAAAAERVTIYAREMRQVGLACYLFDPENADCLTPDEVGALASAPSRYMFKDDRLQTCASLLNDYESKGDRDPYAVSLARVLIAALLAVLGQGEIPPATALTGAVLDRLMRYVLDHLDQSITVEDLASVAAMPPTQFGHAFRAATGLSPQRWQMDARVRSAQRLMLDDPAGSLAEVGELAGFSDQSHFSRAFFEIVGATPTAWLHQRK